MLMILLSASLTDIVLVNSIDNVCIMTCTAILYIVFGQIPHPLASVTKDGSMGLLIKVLLLLLLSS
jgi:hypothetical protein